MIKDEAFKDLEDYIITSISSEERQHININVAKRVLTEACENMQAIVNELQFDKNLANQHLEIQMEFNEAARLKLSEYERLHSELNAIVHPNGGGPEKPSLCDLIAYVQKDLKKSKLSEVTVDELVMEIQERGQEIGFF